MPLLPIVKMTGPVLRSLTRKSACEMYPVAPAPSWTHTRGHIAFEPADCTLCTLCARKCPTGAIQVDRAGRQWTIDPYLCIVCGACVEACPKRCLAMKSDYTAPAATKATRAFTVPAPPPKAKEQG